MPATPHPASAIKSVIDWWALAGVDAAVTDAPRDWLAAERKPAVAPLLRNMAAPSISPPAAPSASPGTVDEFIDWLASSPDLPEAGFPGNRILPRTVVGAPLLIITDMPTDEDMAAGRLLSGADGKLLAAMLRAVGLDEAGVGVASLLLARPAGGMCDGPTWTTAVARMRRYIALTSPGGLLLLGDQTNRALCETDGAGTEENSMIVNYASAMILAMRLPAPHILMRHPARKIAAWAELRKLAARL